MLNDGGSLRSTGVSAVDRGGCGILRWRGRTDAAILNASPADFLPTFNAIAHSTPLPRAKQAFAGYLRLPGVTAGASVCRNSCRRHDSPVAKYHKTAWAHALPSTSPLGTLWFVSQTCQLPTSNIPILSATYYCWPPGGRLHIRHDVSSALPLTHAAPHAHTRKTWRRPDTSNCNNRIMAPRCAFHCRYSSMRVTYALGVGIHSCYAWTPFF